MAALAEQAEAVVEARGDAAGIERADTAGGELERERQAVEAEADARDVRGVRIVEREPGRAAAARSTNSRTAS